MLLLLPNSSPSLLPDPKLNPVATATVFDQQKTAYVFPCIEALISPFHPRVGLQDAGTGNESFQLLATEVLLKVLLELETSYPAGQDSIDDLYLLFATYAKISK